MAFYEKSKEKELRKDLFENPTKEYRGTPFWSWNCKLSEDILREQIDVFSKMGFGGFHMHSRTGMAEEYLGERFMNFVKFCVKEAKDKDMLAYLYDEDRYSSGFAGGYLTKDPKYRSKYLCLTKEKTEAYPKEEAYEEGKPYLVGIFGIKLGEEGELLEYKKLKEGETFDGEIRYAYLKCSSPSPWFNNYTSGDLLDKKTAEEFIKITYGAYEKAVGEEFGKTVPSMFTDEPHSPERLPLEYSNSDRDFTMGWTYSFSEEFEKKYGYDIADKIPEIVWNLPNGEISVARYHYHDFVCEMLVENYLKTCNEACRKNNLLFTGHVMGEGGLESQSGWFGEVMRSYKYFDIPGIDVLCDTVDLITAKQCQSVVHQYGKEGMTCELYGVTNWKFDFRGHKKQGDWLAALGTTVRVPHLAWVSMAGEGKRDYPASIGYQSPWFGEYSYIENHFARVNTALTRGKASVKVGVIHPIESYWINYGPNDKTFSKREQLENNFKNFNEWMLSGTIDYDFISESLLPELFSGCENGKFNVGEMGYEAVIVPNCQMLRGTTVEALKKFCEAGGDVIVAGKYPEYVDAKPQNTKEMLKGSINVEYSKFDILTALSAKRDIEVKEADGRPCYNLVYNLRDEEFCKWLFIAHGKYTECSEDTTPQKLKISISGIYTPVFYNTLNGEISEIPFEYENGKTVVYYNFYQHDSILLKLEKKKGEEFVKKEEKYNKASKIISFKNKVEYALSEPNVLLLDRAEYSLNDEEYNPEEELLRIDNIFRARKGWFRRTESFPQPWVVPEEKIVDFANLRFKIKSDIEVSGAHLAVEDAELIEIRFNGEKVSNNVDGYFTDHAIKTVKLPKIKKGENELVLKIPFGKRSNIEWCYILGEFNVTVEGAEARIVEKTESIGFADLTAQGLPFYGGNIIYKSDINTPNCDLIVHTVNYRGALVKVYVDGEEAGITAFAPYSLRINNVSEGTHKIEFKLFGTRVNSFGELHNIKKPNWVNSEVWRSTGDNWGYEYMFRQTGFLSAPYIEIIEK